MGVFLLFIEVRRIARRAPCRNVTAKLGKGISDLVCWIGVQLDGADGAQTASSQEEFQAAP
jgi:hypothetical protein